MRSKRMKTNQTTRQTMAGKFVCFGFTLNNYSEQELAMIRTFPEFVRECIWELEKGTNETPHVQGYLRLKTQQRISFLLKHFLSRGHYIGLSGDEYRENVKKYVQKQDDTATSAVHQQRQSEPIVFPALVPELIVKEMMVMESEGIDLGLVSLTAEKSDVKARFDRAYEASARRLVKRVRIETIVFRPDIQTSTRLFYSEIKERLTHNTDALCTTE